MHIDLNIYLIIICIHTTVPHTILFDIYVQYRTMHNDNFYLEDKMLIRRSYSIFFMVFIMAQLGGGLSPPPLQKKLLVATPKKKYLSFGLVLIWGYKQK